MKRILFGCLATFTLLGSALASPAAASIAKEKVGGHNCTSSANARVMKGTSKWRDPNTLTHKQAAAMEAQTRSILSHSGIRTGLRPNGSVKIRVHFHGITDKAGHGFVSKARFQAQIKVLNNAYGGRTGPKAADTPFRFRLASIDRRKNTGWYNASAFSPQGNAKLREMRRKLRVGDARDLNLYTVGPKFGLLGFATFPGSYNKYPKLDGAVLFNASLPGGNANFGPGAVYNQGDTATHEIGHWLNLYHTFQGSCSRLNDYVTDTPRQYAGSNIFACDPSLNTCAPFGSKSKDPVKNFMNYVDDPCMNQFTRGQRDRMNTAWFIRLALST
jgi:Pregnancy-associated plasma protein-A